MMPNLTRQSIFAQAAQKLRQDFEELSLIPHKGVKGGEAEQLVRKFLIDHLPKRFDVGAGFIIDRLDNVSKQTDVIVYDALNCPTYRASDEAAIFPSENVAAVVEIKSWLTKQELTKAFLNIRAAKRLAKTPLPDRPDTLMTSQTMGCLFAFKSAITLEKIAEHLTDLLKKYSIGHHIDLILVLDKGTISMWCKPRFFEHWGIYLHEGTGGAAAEGLSFALGIEQFGKDSLDVFLRYLLTHLSLFRGLMDHPGLNWSVNPNYAGTKLQYLATHTNEMDPNKRRKIGEQYQREVRDEFARDPFRPKE